MAFMCELNVDKFGPTPRRVLGLHRPDRLRVCLGWPFGASGQTLGPRLGRPCFSLTLINIRGADHLAGQALQAVQMPVGGGGPGRHA